MCEFCMRHAGNGQECGKDYTIHPCANGDLGVRAEYIDGGIVLFKDHNMASGYFDINYCPICGRRMPRRLILNRFLSRKFLKICITLMAGLWP